jgi:hypothetical protein
VQASVVLFAWVIASLNDPSPELAQLITVKVRASALDEKKAVITKKNIIKCFLAKAC